MVFLSNFVPLNGLQGLPNCQFLLDKQASYRKVVVLADHKLVKVFSSSKCNYFESVDDLNLPAPTAFCIICHCEIYSHSAIFGTGFSVTILL